MRVSFKSFWTVYIYIYIYYIYIWEVCLLIISLYGAWYVEVECTIYWGREKNKETILSSLQAWEIHTPFVYIFHVHIQIATFLKKGVYIYIYIYIYIYLSHKLRCYTEISGTEKSRNDTRFHTCWHSQSATDT